MNLKSNIFKFWGRLKVGYFSNERVFSEGSSLHEGTGEGMEAKQQNRDKRFFGTQPKKNGPDGPNASRWYGQLRGPISPLLVLNSDQLPHEKLLGIQRVSNPSTKNQQISNPAHSNGGESESTLVRS